jgi:ligand-binding sensor domain-containing protein
MYVDHEKGTWISTLNDGVFYFKNADVTTDRFKVENEDIIDIEFDNKKRLWITTQNGDVFIKSENDVKQVSSSRLKRPAFLSLNKNNDILYYYSDGEIRNSQNSLSIVVGSLSNIEAQENGSVLLFGVQSVKRAFLGKKKHQFVHSGYRFHDGMHFKNNWYFATERGLYREEAKKLVPVDESSIESKAVLDVRIEDLCLFQNTLLVASRGNGIVIYDGSKVIGRITTNEGLTSNFISKMYVENQHTLWVCTNVGLNRIHIDEDGTYTISNITYKDGLSSNEVSSLAIDNDMIWVGTKEGLNYFSRSYFDRTVSQIDYRLKLNKVLVNDKKWSKTEKVRLSYDQNRLEFSFAGISFNQSKKLTYRYKLEGLDENWTYTTNRSTTYPNLAPGNYVFKVQVKGKNREWEMQKASMDITIFPPFSNK